MHKTIKTFSHILREHVTHWVTGGILVTLTGFAPEEWFARSVHALHLPEGALHLWSVGLDARVVPIVLGMSVVVGHALLRKRKSDLRIGQLSATEERLAALPTTDRATLRTLSKADVEVSIEDTLWDPWELEPFSRFFLAQCFKARFVNCLSNHNSGEFSIVKYWEVPPEFFK